jgi:hypothetical protein
MGWVMTGSGGVAACTYYWHFLILAQAVHLLGFSGIPSSLSEAGVTPPRIHWLTALTAAPLPACRLPPLAACSAGP